MTIWWGPFVFIFVILNSLAALFAFIPPEREKGHVFSENDTLYSIRRLLSYFQAKVFPLNPVLQIDAIIGLF